MKLKLRWRDSPVGRAVRLLRNAVSPSFEVTDAPTDIHVDWNVPVTMRDGAVLRVNVFRPKDGKPAPVIMSAHPYSKDLIPANTRSGYGPHLQARFITQPHKISLSQWTGWETPDPAFWVRQGYVIINADLRGGGTSDGPGDLFSDEEALDYRELILWAGTQSWSSGRVGLDGVGYIAIAQYKVAALQPPNLAAICPWEGFSDLYRDFARPGGIREDGFSILWSKLTGMKTRMRTSMRDGIIEHVELDEYYKSRTPDLSRIQVPILICASFSDHNLHTRGCFEVFRRAGSDQKWLHTHRDGKWSSYYGKDSIEARLRFYDYTLKGLDNGLTTEPRVRLAIHEGGPDPIAVVYEQTWPPQDLTWRDLWLDASSGTIAEGAAPVVQSSAAFNTRRGSASFVWTVPEDMDVIGPMVLELFVDLRGADDASLFVGVRKGHLGFETTFEGSYGFSSDMVSKGWLRLAHRALDPVLSTREQPVHRHDRAVPLSQGEIVPIQIGLREHATRFRKGDQLCLEIQGKWLYPGRVFGQFPAQYQPSPRATCTLHTGGQFAAYLRLGTRSVPAERSLRSTEVD